MLILPIIHRIARHIQERTQTVPLQKTFFARRKQMSMSQRRGTTTDNLNNVIQVIQLGRKTGVLTVERGHETTLEFGEITFVYGQITYAHIGELDGQIAVNVLCSWGLCRFLFTPAASE
jgi:hypothetical protein